MRVFLIRQWLLLGLLGAVILAFFKPEWGASGGKLHSEITTHIGIILIFLFQGWMLPTEVLAQCMLRWKAHLFTQIFVFLVFPLLVILGDQMWASSLSGPLRIGFLFLAVLPTTITSAIVFTSQAGGNTGVALFNTTVSNIAGVLITPLWMTFLVKTDMGQVGDLSSVFLTLSKLILLPLLAGQIAHIFIKGKIERFKPLIGYFNQTVIIFIVFAAFSNSVVGGVWENQAQSMVLITVGISTVLFLIVAALCLWMVHALKFSKEDQAAIFFCGTQKTLAAGVPLGISLFGADPAFGLILLPVMIFHPIQLVLGAILIRRFQHKAK